MGRRYQSQPPAWLLRVPVEPDEERTPSELHDDRLAALADRERRRWLKHTPLQLASRIPVSVFDLGWRAARDDLTP